MFKRLMAGGVLVTALMLVGAGCPKTSSTNGSTDSTDDREQTVNVESNESSSGDQFVIENGTKGPYGVKEGYVRSELSAILNTSSSQELYFTDYGNTQVMDNTATSTFGDQTYTTRTRTISNIKEKSYITLDLDRKTGMKVVVTPEAEKLFETVGEEVKDQLDMSVTGTETVAGKECGVIRYNAALGTVCLWEGIALKTTFDPSQETKFESVATEVRIGNGEFDDSLLVIPEGITVEEVSYTELLTGAGDY